jgi:hypothetical protein
MLQRQLSHLNGRKLDHRQVQFSYIFYVWSLVVIRCEHVHPRDFVRLLLVVCAILLHNQTHLKPRSQYLHVA